MSNLRDPARRHTLQECEVWCEVTCRLMDADFLSTPSLYWSVSGVPATWANACLGVVLIEPVQPLFCFASSIAHFGPTMKRFHYLMLMPLQRRTSPARLTAAVLHSCQLRFVGQQASTRSREM